MLLLITTSRKLTIKKLGYTYDETRERFNAQPDGSKAAWSTISYANGPGFYSHFTNHSERPWKDIRDMDFTDDQYMAPALLPTFDGYETHGGEDVPFLAIGPWAHLFTGVQEQSYFAQAIEHAAGWSDDNSNEHLYSNSKSQNTSQLIIILITLCIIILV